MPSFSFDAPRDRSVRYQPYSKTTRRSYGHEWNHLLRDHHPARVPHPVVPLVYTLDAIALETSNELTLDPTPLPCGNLEDAALPAWPYPDGSQTPSPLCNTSSLGFTPTANGLSQFNSFIPLDSLSLFPTSSYMASLPSPAMDDIRNEFWETTNSYYPPYPAYTADAPIVNSATQMHCQWDTCEVLLDDISHSGLRRHFREYHHASRGDRLRCKWGGCCRAEEMLFENIPKHIAECHVKSMAQRCAYCNGTFARKDTLKRHQTAGCPALGQQAQ